MSAVSGRKKETQRRDQVRSEMWRGGVEGWRDGNDEGKTCGGEGMKEEGREGGKKEMKEITGEWINGGRNKEKIKKD